MIRTDKNRHMHSMKIVQKYDLHFQKIPEWTKKIQDSKQNIAHSS